MRWIYLPSGTNLNQWSDRVQSSKHHLGEAGACCEDPHHQIAMIVMPFSSYVNGTMQLFTGSADVLVRTSQMSGADSEADEDVRAPSEKLSSFSQGTTKGRQKYL
jgi:hypothetical protein